MLTRCGIAFRAQERVEVLVEDRLPVAGKPDLITAVADWRAVSAYVKQELDGDRVRDGLPELESLQRLLAKWQARKWPRPRPRPLGRGRSLTCCPFD